MSIQSNKLTEIADAIREVDGTDESIAANDFPNRIRSISPGVKSFNGRTGEVVPADGDYTAEQVGALPLAGGTMTGAITKGKITDGSNTVSVSADYGSNGIKISGTQYTESSNCVYFNPDPGGGRIGFGRATFGNTGKLIRLCNIADPIGDGEAANKAYVDSKSGGLKPQIIVSVETGANVTAEKGALSVAAVSENGAAVLNIPEYGNWTVTASKGGKEAFGTAFIDAVKQYQMKLSFAHIYGVLWDGSSTAKWTRTDDAAGFTDPVPYTAGKTAAQCSSPFDNRLPWSGMVKSTRTGGVMVAIPKFWYKLTKNGNGLKIQIADSATEGFSVSPAHMDRGDGKGERDVAYIGRYHCGSDFKSNTAQTPKLNATRANFRTSIHALGTNIWQADFAMRFTLWLLYLVEFADWNSQATIGKGCGNNSGVQSMGYTDSMPYHTGTTQSNRDTYGLGTQYRNIEGLWDNCCDFCDGCYNNSNGMNIILNPSNFSDSSGGTSVGTPTSGWPSAFNVVNQAGFPMIIPSASNGGENVAPCDYWGFSISNPVVFAGGDYSQYGHHGLFFVSFTGVASTGGGGLASRLQELP